MILFKNKVLHILTYGVCIKYIWITYILMNSEKGQSVYRVSGTSGIFSRIV